MLIGILGLFGLHGLKYFFNTFSGKNETDKYGVYIDKNGTQRFTRNNKRVIETYNENGEKIIKYVKTGKTALNIDSIEANKRKLSAIKKGDNFYLLWLDKQQGYKYKSGKNIKGNRYCSTSSDDEMYVIRQVSYSWNDVEPPLNCWNYLGDYYMNMDFKFCFPTDEQKNKDKEKYGDKCDEIEKYIIDVLNEKINQIRSNKSNEKYYLPLNERPFYIGNSNNYSIVKETLDRRK